MAVYLQVAIKSFQRHLAYRAANLAGIITNLFFGAIYVFIYMALFQNKDVMGGLTLKDTVTYLVITQSLLMTMSAFGNLELSEAIIQGDIVVDLTRPVDCHLYWGAIDLGRAVYYAIFRGLPTFLLGMLIFHARFPRSPEMALLFLAAVLSGMLVSFSFRFIVSSLAFWTTDARGINYLASTIILFFAGFAVPLNFFPGPLRAVADRLPFRAMADLPIQVYLGKVDEAALFRALAVQALWLAVLILVGRLVLSRMMRRLSSHGG